MWLYILCQFGKIDQQRGCDEINDQSTDSAEGHEKLVHASGFAVPVQSEFTCGRQALHRSANAGP
jgi:hypothetical protein